MSELVARCYWLEPLPRVRRALLRYQGLHRGYQCPNDRQRHEAKVVLDVVPHPLEEQRRTIPMDAVSALLDSEPTWPERCQTPGCSIEGGYLFTPKDPGLLLLDRMARRSDTGEEVVQYECTAGGVFDVSAYIAEIGPDGRSLAVMTPQGLWFMDTSHVVLGATWTRSGEAPALTVTQRGGAHFGWELRDGALYRVDP
jgi:hypothetical protein